MGLWGFFGGGYGGEGRAGGEGEREGERDVIGDGNRQEWRGYGTDGLDCKRGCVGKNRCSANPVVVLAGAICSEAREGSCQVTLASTVKNAKTGFLAYFYETGAKRISSRIGGDSSGKMRGIRGKPWGTGEVRSGGQGG